uniref:Uncharacterized protein n=1 Tax=Brassica oleracea var. oleracea TaxID=109376 RepID=A0A0D3AU71_BRAOL
MAAQQAGYEAQRRLNQQMMEMMQRMYPNEGRFPRNIPTNRFLGIFRGKRSSEYSEGPTEFRGNKIPRKFRGSPVCRKCPRNIPREDFVGKKKFRGIISDDLFRRYVVGITIFRRNSDDFFPQNPCCFLVVPVTSRIGYRSEPSTKPLESEVLLVASDAGTSCVAS